MSRKKTLLLYEPDNLVLIQGWLKDGLTIEQICKNLGVSRNVWHRAIKENEDFAAITRRTKDIVDREVENSLFKRAMGYEYNEITEEYEMGFLVKKKVVRKHVAPDTGAMVFWLKNKKSDSWKDKREVDNTVALNKLDEVLDQIKGCE